MRLFEEVLKKTETHIRYAITFSRKS